MTQGLGSWNVPHGKLECGQIIIIPLLINWQTGGITIILHVGLLSPHVPCIQSETATLSCWEEGNDCFDTLQGRGLQLWRGGQRWSIDSTSGAVSTVYPATRNIAFPERGFVVSLCQFLETPSPL